MRQTLDPVDARIAAALMLAPRLSWRDLGHHLALSERTVVRRTGPLFADGTLRATAVRNPYAYPDLVPLALRLECHPAKARDLALVLARRPDTIWVDVVGGGHELSSVHFSTDANERDRLLLEQLPATSGIVSWRSHELLRTFQTAFCWTGGHLTAEETGRLRSTVDFNAAPIELRPYDEAMVTSLIHDGRTSYSALADRAKVSSITARQRVTALTSSGAIRLATELNLRLLGARTEALIWMHVEPTHLETVGLRLARQPQVRFVAATTGPTNLLVAVATADRRALYTYLTESLGPVSGISAPDVSPILMTMKRTGLIRPASTNRASGEGRHS